MNHCKFRPHFFPKSQKKFIAAVEKTSPKRSENEAGDVFAIKFDSEKKTFVLRKVSDKETDSKIEDSYKRADHYINEMSDYIKDSSLGEDELYKQVPISVGLHALKLIYENMPNNDEKDKFIQWVGQVKFPKNRKNAEFTIKLSQAGQNIGIEIYEVKKAADPLSDLFPEKKEK